MNTPSTHPARLLRMVLLLAFLGSPPAFAQNVTWGANATAYWTGNSSSNWNTSSNWSPRLPI